MEVIAYIVIALHVICAVGLVLFVLLHSGKGTGVSSLFGAGLPSSATGTGMIEKNLEGMRSVMIAVIMMSAAQIIHFILHDARILDVIQKFGCPRFTAILAVHGRAVLAGEISR